MEPRDGDGPLDERPGRGHMVNTIAPSPQRPARIVSFLFPEEPRSFPFRRSARTGLRAVHILSGGVLLGGYIFDHTTAELNPWLLGTAISGLLLLATDLHASLAVLCEVRGLAMLVKLALLGLVPVFREASISLLVAVLVIGAISSHMPGKYRHKVLLFRDRVVPERRRGSLMRRTLGARSAWLRR